MKREAPARRYAGPFKTKLRMVLYTGSGFIVSEPFAGSIDERQLAEPKIPGSEALRQMPHP